MRRFVFGFILVIFIGLSVIFYFATAPVERKELSEDRQTVLPTDVPQAEATQEVTPTQEVTQIEATQAADPVFQSQSQMPLLVNAQNPLPEGYKPQELVKLYDKKDRGFQLSASNIKVEGETYRAMKKMFLAAADDGVDGFIVTSGYRTRKRQQELYEERQDDTVQQPGCSEHESGLAFDVTARGSQDGFDTTKQFKWLFKHCAEYGFILRYPEGKEQETGIAYEPWHYRYVGVDVAQEIMSRGITLEAYCAERGA